MMKTTTMHNNFIGKLAGTMLTLLFSGLAFAYGQNCTQRSGGIINDGQSVQGYSTIKWAITGENYPDGCIPFSGTLTCSGGNIIGNYSTYRYNFNQCDSGTPRNCTQRSGGPISHGTSLSAYSSLEAIFPKTCENNYSTTLTCINGIINGNWQTYTYPTCTTSGALVTGIDLTLDESLGLTAGGNLVAQGSSPELRIVMRNKGTDLINTSIGSKGFLTCTWKEQNLTIYESKPISSFVVNPGTKIGVNIRLQPLFSQALGTKTIECSLNMRTIGISDKNTENNTRSQIIEVVKADRFDLALSKSIEPISKNLESAEGAKGTQGIENFLFDNIMGVLVPLIIVLGILSAILGFYKIMFSTDDAATKDGVNYILYGVIGIIIIMSARFIGAKVFDLLNPTDGQISGATLAQGLYGNVIYPFIKFAIYIVLGAMFVILVSRVITFLFGSDSDAQKKAGTLIGWNVIAMFIIIGAKQIVETVYGKQADVVKNVSNLGEVGSGILADKNIPLLYQIINYALGAASLVILVIIIIQTIQLLTKPDDPAQIKKIKNSLVYIFIGILIIGAGYLITNFAIIN